MRAACARRSLPRRGEKPFLGICIGLQMLFERSEEGDTPGLGLLRGRGAALSRRQDGDAHGSRLKVPHMGWNEVRAGGRHTPLWHGIPQGSRFYFVHSYYVEPAERGIAAGTSAYGLQFTCAVARDNVFAVQFHPEKSQAAGLRLLANFVAWQPAVARAPRPVAAA